MNRPPYPRTARALPATEYRGQVFIVTDEGVASPLAPGQVIPDERVILIGLAEGAATVLDGVDAGDLAAYNVQWRCASPLHSNTALLSQD